MANKKLLPKAYRNIGKRLQDLREDLDLSNAEMARLCKLVKRSYIRNEEGATYPSITTLNQLSEGYNVSMDWLLFDEGTMYRQKISDTPPTPEITETREQTDENERAEQTERQELPEIASQDEVRELLEHMDRIPMLKYELLLQFQNFKIDRKEIVDAAMRDTEPETAD